MAKAPEKRCPICAKPILLGMSFCRPHWFELPISIRDAITLAIQQKHFTAKARAMSEALEWFKDKRAGVQIGLKSSSMRK
jgi:hypothetical protein